VGLQHVDYINCLFVVGLQHVDYITVYLLWRYNM